MKNSEIRQLTPKKLRELLVSSRRELARVKFHLKTGQSTDSASIKKNRRLIARILTHINATKLS